MELPITSIFLHLKFIVLFFLLNVNAYGIDSNELSKYILMHYLHKCCESSIDLYRAPPTDCGEGSLVSSRKERDLMHVIGSFSFKKMNRPTDGPLCIQF